MPPRRPSTKAKIAALKEGRRLSVDPEALAYARHPDPDERAVLILSSCYSRQRVPEPAAVSWADQVRAAEFFNANGLAKTLDECVRIDPHALD